MPLILYAQLVIGILFVIRTIQVFRARALISDDQATKTGTSFVCANLLVSFFGASAPILCAGLLAGMIPFAVCAMFFLERRKISRLKGEIPAFLDCWILNLRLGFAVSAAREAALREQDESFQILLRPVFNAQTGAKRRHILLSIPLAEEFENLAREPHSALSRLENLRAYLKTSAEFRRKSGQATRQATIQASVMTVLLFALMIFTVHRYGWRQSGDLILASIFLSMAGVLCMCWIARKGKWKI